MSDFHLVFAGIFAASFLISALSLIVDIVNTYEKKSDDA